MKKTRTSASMASSVKWFLLITGIAIWLHVLVTGPVYMEYERVPRPERFLKCLFASVMILVSISIKKR